MATSADVPNKYDVVIDGKGYMLADTEDVKAQYGYTRTFVERSNTQGAFGDQFQDFWMTSAQSDWSLGEPQRYFRANDEDSRRRYWKGSGVDVHIPGQVSIRNAVKSLSFGSAPVTGTGIGGVAYLASSSNLFEVSSSFVITDRGAHGLGAGPAVFGCSDGGLNVFITSLNGGSVGVRKWNGAAFSTFSASGADSIAYLNNALYGYRTVAADLVRWDTAGVISSLFAFKAADGPAFVGGTTPKVVPYGGKVALLRTGSGYRPAIFLYDGVGVSEICTFDQSFSALDMVELGGVLFVGGNFQGGSGGYAGIQYFANGTQGLLWKSDVTTSVSMRLGVFQGTLIWQDDATQSYMRWQPDTGAISRFATAPSSTQTALVSSSYYFLASNTGTTMDGYPDTTTATSAAVTSSLFDFDSSLDKLFRGIKVDFTAATDGNGGSVDIAYRVGDVDGSYTTLQTGATSGTEYTLSGISGRSVSVKVTINKGTSTSGPLLKRVSVRAAPKQLAFQRGTLVIQSTGRDGKVPMRLRDGKPEPRDGLTIATDLRAVAAASTPVSMTTEFGTISNVVLENDGFEVRRIRPNEFVVVAPWREV